METVKKIIDGTLYTVVAFIFNDENQILMFDRKGEAWETGWEPIKGAIHTGETEEEALLREIEEEAGVNVKVLKKLTDHFFAQKPLKDGSKLEVNNACFVCAYIDGEIHLGEEEHIGYKWMTLEEAKEKIWIPNSKPSLEQAFEAYTKWN
ncbi:NUDIX hydrolase [Thermoproteota archaeon]